MLIRSLLALSSALCAAAAGATPVVTAHMVKDLNAAPAQWQPDSRPANFVALDGKVYFAANSPAHGVELFESDGVSAQARLMGDLVPGALPSNVQPLGLIGNRILVETRREGTGSELWTVDRSTQAAGHVADLGRWDGSLDPETRVVGSSAGRVFFNIYEFPYLQLWASDGTAAGTQLLLGMPVDWTSPGACALPQRVVAAQRGTAGRAVLWGSDGTQAGTTLIATSLQGVTAVRMNQYGNYCYALMQRGQGWELWRSNGTANGTNMLAQSSSGSPRGAAAIGQAAFVMDSTATQFRLWRNDAAQPVLTHQGVLEGEIELAAVGGKLVYFAPAAGSTFGKELFLSAGTAAAGAQQVTPGVHGVYAHRIYCTRVVGSRVFFWYAQGASEGWSLDVTTGTLQRYNESGALACGNAVLNGVAFGAGGTLDDGEVWRSDGTAAGTFRLHDIWQATEGSVFAFAATAASGNVLVTSALRDPVDGNDTRRALLRTDGTAEGTWALPRSAYDEGSVRTVVTFGDTLAFASLQADSVSRRYYRTDGNLSAAQPIGFDATRPTLSPLGGSGVLFSCDVSGSSHSLCALRVGDAQVSLVSAGMEDFAGVRVLSSIGNVTFFFGPDNGLANRRGLWRSDGTAPGTFQLSTDLVPFASDRSASQRYGSALLFDACLYATGDCGLYTSDGSVAGTRRIMALLQPVGSFAPVGTRMAFSTFDGFESSELWSTDATAAGTVRLGAQWRSPVFLQLASSGAQVHGIARTQPVPSGFDYIVSDGTLAGTRTVAMPEGFEPSWESIAALDADHVVFSCLSHLTGTELCLARGGDVRLLGDFFPGQSSSWARLLGRTDTAAYFTLNDGYHGSELWRIAVVSEQIFAAGFQP
jgi:ELWxxDGT repeat protein